MRSIFIRPLRFSVLTAAALFGLASSSAQAALLNVSVAQVGGNVVMAGSGDIDLTDGSTGSASTSNAYIEPDGSLTNSDFGLGPATSTACTFYTYSTTITGPANFGTTGLTNASSGSGDVFAFEYFAPSSFFGRPIPASIYFRVPTGYVSDTSLSDTAVFNNTTLSALGLTPGGTYTWTEGPNPATTLNTVTLSVAAVPEPTSFGLLALGSAGVLAWRRRRTAPAR